MSPIDPVSLASRRTILQIGRVLRITNSRGIGRVSVGL
jgi:hypothetical protein